MSSSFTRFVVMMMVLFGVALAGCAEECRDLCDASCDQQNQASPDSCTEEDRNECKAACNLAL